MLTNKERENLVLAAREIQSQAYAPYSRYKVGSAVLTKNGRVFTGFNIENAAYPAVVCAERVAMFKAISEGEKEFRAIAVVTGNGGSPCGVCRQVMAEFGLETIVIIADGEGNIVAETSVNELLPHAFTPKNLP
jgi:cytidine deaminase